MQRIHTNNTTLTIKIRLPSYNLWRLTLIIIIHRDSGYAHWEHSGFLMEDQLVIVVCVNNQPDHFFNVFISLLCVFRATQCSSSGESIVSIHHLVSITLCRWLFVIQVSDLHQTATYTEWYTHIPDDVLIQLILLMMSTGLLETCTQKWNKHI